MYEKDLYRICEDYEEDKRNTGMAWRGSLYMDIYSPAGDAELERRVRKHALHLSKSPRGSMGRRCHCGWRGNRHADQARCAERQGKGRNHGLDNVLKSTMSDGKEEKMHFNTTELAQDCELWEIVTCAHILGRAGLLVEPKRNAAIEYQRISVCQTESDTDEKE